jgi:hypothetical protein
MGLEVTKQCSRDLGPRESSLLNVRRAHAPWRVNRSWARRPYSMPITRKVT